MKQKTLVFVLLLTFGLAGIANAHFGMVIPSKPVVMESRNSAITLDIKFWHPFENNGMNLVKPKVFNVYYDGKATDFLPQLKETKEQGYTKWSLDYKLAKPGLYAFVMEPVPYWESEEDSFIIHYTKAYVGAFGDDEGWDEPLGLKTEIMPLSNPTGLYAGNVFQGQVLLDGEPVADAEVEIEWYPGMDKKGVAPHNSMITQMVKADSNGVFTYAAPKEGWWGFAALNTADYTMKQDGENKDVELGAVIWVYFHNMLPAETITK